jgi:hypothetical protein
MMEKHALIRDLISKVSHNQQLSAQDRQTLLALLTELEQQVTAHASTHETAQKLRNSVQTFETTHPELVETVNRLCVMLANLGI